MSTLDQIKEIKAEINKLRKEAKEKVQEIFKIAALELFVQYPNLTRISWTQYTPYFNDGDTCEFGSNHTSPAIYFTTTADEDEFDGYEEEWSEFNYKTWDSTKRKYIELNLTDTERAEVNAGNAVLEFLDNFDNEDMENLFGDHVKVIITKKKIETEYYNHD